MKGFEKKQSYLKYSTSLLEESRKRETRMLLGQESPTSFDAPTILMSCASFLSVGFEWKPKLLKFDLQCPSIFESLHMQAALRFIIIFNVRGL